MANMAMISTQVVHGLAALPRIMGDPNGSGHLHATSYLGASTAIYCRVLWIHRVDAVFRNQSTLLF